MDAVIINQDSLHFEICLFAVFLVFEFNECILETVTGTLVSNDFARDYRTETAEDGVQILVCF